MTTDGNHGNAKLGRLVEDMVLQSDRIAQNLKPIHAMIDAIEDSDNVISIKDFLHLLAEKICLLTFPVIILL
jgi:hypothetical protein